MYRKTLRINLFGIEPPVEEALRRAAPLDRFEHAVEAFPTVDGEAFCSCDIAVVDLRLFAGSPGGARPSRCLADLAARRRERLDTFYSATPTWPSRSSTSTPPSTPSPSSCGSRTRTAPTSR